MTKSSKKLLALLLAVMFAFSAVPFTASAAETTNTVNVTGIPGVNYNLYKIASVSAENGEYVPSFTRTDDTKAVYDEIVAAKDNTTALYQALDQVADSAIAGYGSVVKTFAFTDTQATIDYTGDDGIYYLRRTTDPMPVNIEQITRGSVFALPIATDEASFSVAAKVKYLGEPTVQKKIQVENGTTPAGDTNYNDVDYATAGSLDTIRYKLTADITGSMDNKLKKYVIADKMDPSLDETKVTIVSVTLKSSDYTDVTLTDGMYHKNAFGSDYTFGLFIDSAVLGGRQVSGTRTFYDYDTVEVIFTTALKNTAPHKTLLPNKDWLVYNNNSTNVSQPEDTDTVKEGDEVNVEGFKLNVVKKDKDGVTKLEGAEFELYKNADCTDKVDGVKAVSDANGVAEFKFSNGSYFLAKSNDKFWAKETKAPVGYTLNPNPVEIQVGDNGQTSEVVVTDTKIKLPETGGAGTMMFTLIGAGLMIVAGVLFVVVYKKRSAK